MFIIRDLMNYSSPLQWNNEQALEGMREVWAYGKTSEIY